MTEEQELAVLRAAQRAVQIAFRWLPYADELSGSSEKIKQNHYTDELALRRCSELVNRRLTEAQEAVLNIAEHNGSKS